MDEEHYETERKLKDTCGFKKKKTKHEQQNTTKHTTTKNRASFLWKNKNYFPCKAMTICQAFRAQCEQRQTSSGFALLQLYSEICSQDLPPIVLLLSYITSQLYMSKKIIQIYTPPVLNSPFKQSSVLLQERGALYELWNPFI